MLINLRFKYQMHDPLETRFVYKQTDGLDYSGSLTSKIDNPILKQSQEEETMVEKTQQGLGDFLTNISPSIMPRLRLIEMARTYDVPSPENIQSLDGETGHWVYMNNVRYDSNESLFSRPNPTPSGFVQLDRFGTITFKNRTIQRLDGKYHTDNVNSFSNHLPWFIGSLDNTSTVAHNRGEFNSETGMITLNGHPYFKDGQYQVTDWLQPRSGISVRLIGRKTVISVTNQYDLMNQNGIYAAGDYSYDHLTGQFTQ